MQALTSTETGSPWLLELSSRLLLLGWFTLAGVAFGLLCSVVILRTAARRETLEMIRFAA